MEGLGRLAERAATTKPHEDGQEPTRYRFALADESRRALVVTGSDRPKRPGMMLGRSSRRHGNLP
jgi:hypothetical protein